MKNLNNLFNRKMAWADYFLAEEVSYKAEACITFDLERNLDFVYDLVDFFDELGVLNEKIE